MHLLLLQFLALLVHEGTSDIARNIGQPVLHWLGNPCHFDHELIESFNARICPTPVCPLQPSSVQWSRSFRWLCCLILWTPKLFGVFVAPLSSTQFKTDKEECFNSEREPLTLRCCQPVVLVPVRSRHNTLKGFVKDGLVLGPTPNAPQT